MSTANRSGVLAAGGTGAIHRQRAAAFLAANVRRVRHERGMNQEQLAAACGWAQARISALESGRQDRKLGTVEVLAASLGVTVESLLREPDVDGGDDGEDDGDGDYGIFFDDDDDDERGHGRSRSHGHSDGDDEDDEDNDDGDD